MTRLVIGLWVMQIVAAVAMLVASFVEIKSIVFVGPALSVIGLAFAAVTRQVNSWAALTFGLSGPLFCALVALLIYSNEWTAREAERPVPVLIGVYLIAALPLSIKSLTTILRWLATTPPQERYFFRFSLKSLLIWMTVICFLIALLQAIVQMPTRYLGRDGPIFLGFALTVLVPSAAILWEFLSMRREQSQVHLSPPMP